MQNWRSEVTISHKHSTERDVVIEILSEFTSMWDVNLWLIEISIHRIELRTENAQPVY